MSTQQVLLVLIAAGAVMLVLGLVYTTGDFSWFGRLPGDLTIVREQAHVFVPVTSMVLLSIVLTSLLRTLFFVYRRYF